MKNPVIQTKTYVGLDEYCQDRNRPLWSSEPSASQNGPTSALSRANRNGGFGGWAAINAKRRKCQEHSANHGKCWEQPWGRLGRSPPRLRFPWPHRQCGQIPFHAFVQGWATWRESSVGRKAMERRKAC